MIITIIARSISTAIFLICMLVHILKYSFKQELACWFDIEGDIFHWFDSVDMFVYIS